MQVVAQSVKGLTPVCKHGMHQAARGTCTPRHVTPNVCIWEHLKVSPFFYIQLCDRKHRGKQRDGLLGNTCVHGPVSTGLLFVLEYVITLLCETTQEGWPAIGDRLEAMTAFQQPAAALRKLSPASSFHQLHGVIYSHRHVLV